MHKNRYYALRHGFSKANERGVIISQYAQGRLLENGLASSGQDQALKAGKVLREMIRDKANCYLFASDFSRTRETAELVAQGAGLGQDSLYLCPDLRERYFGELDMGPNDRYIELWQYDAIDPDHTTFKAESPTDVAARAMQAVDLAERAFNDADIVLVSHGDCLQILQTQFRHVSAARHRSLPHLETGELRPL